MIIDIPFFYIEDLIPKDIVKKIRKEYKCCRFYINSKEDEYTEQKEMYKHLTAIGYTKDEALNAVSNHFDRTKQTISKHIQKGLFDAD